MTPRSKTQNMKPIKDAIAQSNTFIEAARELGCDEDEARFEESLRRVIRHEPQPEPVKKSPQKKAPSKA